MECASGRGAAWEAGGVARDWGHRDGWGHLAAGARGWRCRSVRGRRQRHALQFFYAIAGRKGLAWAQANRSSRREGQTKRPWFKQNKRTHAQARDAIILCTYGYTPELTTTVTIGPIPVKTVKMKDPPFLEIVLG